MRRSSIRHEKIFLDHGRQIDNRRPLRSATCVCSTHLQIQTHISARIFSCPHPAKTASPRPIWPHCESPHDSDSSFSLLAHCSTIQYTLALQQPLLQHGSSVLVQCVFSQPPRRSNIFA